MATFFIFFLLYPASKVFLIAFIQSGTAASWAQAVGGVLAIVGAFVIARNQRIAADRTRLIDAAEKSANLSNLCVDVATEAHSAIAQVERVFRSHRTGTRVRHQANRLKQAQGMVIIVLGKDIPSDLAYPLIQLQRLLDITTRALESELRKPKSAISPTKLLSAKTRCDRALEALLAITEVVEHYYSQLSDHSVSASYRRRGRPTSSKS